VFSIFVKTFTEQDAPGSFSLSNCLCSSILKFATLLSIDASLFESCDRATAGDSDKLITPTLSFHARSGGEAVHLDNDFSDNLSVRNEKEDEDPIMSSSHANQPQDDDDIDESEMDHVISYATRGTVRKKMMERPSRVSPPSTRSKKRVGGGTPSTGRKKPPLTDLPQRKV